MLLPGPRRMPTRPTAWCWRGQARAGERRTRTHIKPGFHQFEPYALVVRRDDPDFRLAVDACARRHLQVRRNRRGVCEVAGAARPARASAQCHVLPQFTSRLMVRAIFLAMLGALTGFVPPVVAQGTPGAADCGELRDGAVDQSGERASAMDAARLGARGRRHGRRPGRPTGKRDDVFDRCRASPIAAGVVDQALRGARPMRGSHEYPAAAVGCHRRGGQRPAAAGGGSVLEPFVQEGDRVRVFGNQLELVNP